MTAHRNRLVRSAAVETVVWQRRRRIVPTARTHRPTWRSSPTPGPIHRAIVAVDIVASTARTNPGRGRLRNALYALLDEALTQSGIAERHRDRMVDRGDGALVIVHPVDEVPKTLLINTFIPALSNLIAEHNRDHDPLRLRASLHAGEIHYDNRGPFGEALDIACRLVDAPELKDTTSRTSAPLVLAVSDHIFQSLIRHRYTGIDDNAYLPLVRIDIGGREYGGWISVPGDL